MLAVNLDRNPKVLDISFGTHRYTTDCGQIIIVRDVNVTLDDLRLINFNLTTR